MCPECGAYAATARAADDGFFAGWWLVPAAVSATCLVVALFFACTSGHRSVSSAGQSSATRLLATPRIENKRIVEGVTLADLRLIAEGVKRAPFVPSDLRLNGDRRFRLDAVEAPLIVTAIDRIDGTICSEVHIGWPAPWLVWRTDRKAPDLSKPPPALSAKPTPSQFHGLWFMTTWSSFPSTEVTSSVLLLHLPFLIPALLAFVLLGCIRFAWHRLRGSRPLPIGAPTLWLLLALPLWLWPGEVTDLASCVAGPTTGSTSLMASDVYVTRDTPEESRRLAGELVRALDAVRASNPEAFIGFGYSDLVTSSGAPAGSRLPFSVDEYAAGVFELFRVWQVDGNAPILPGRFVNFGPMGEVYVRTQSANGVGTVIISVKSILMLLALCMMPFMVVRLWRMSRADRLNRRHDMSSCLHCGYDLRVPAARAH